MALNIGSLSSALAPNAAAQLASLARTNAMQYTAEGMTGQADDSSDGISIGTDIVGSGLAGTGFAGIGKAAAGAKGSSFESALLKAIDGVSASQTKSDSLLQQVVANPDSVDAQDVTIAMAEANMSLNLAKTIMSRIVTAWKDVINTR
jgi:flagellar hook-basal body complex protein FliE